MTAATTDGWFSGRRPTHRPTVSPIAFLSSLDSPEWMDQGLCAQTDPETWFPEKGGSVREAKAICATCPVVAECLDYALARQERFGIWGGLSERERRRLKAAPNADPRPCRRSDCTETIPATAHASKRYHDIDCANRAREDFIIAGLDQDRILTAYAAAGSITVVAKQHKVPIRVISRVLDARGIRPMRSRTKDQEAS